MIIPCKKTISKHLNKGKIMRNSSTITVYESSIVQHGCRDKTHYTLKGVNWKGKRENPPECKEAHQS